MTEDEEEIPAEVSALIGKRVQIDASDCCLTVSIEGTLAGVEVNGWPSFLFRLEGGAEVACEAKAVKEVV